MEREISCFTECLCT